MFGDIGELDDNTLIFWNPVPETAAIRKKILETLFDRRASWLHKPSEHFKKFVTHFSLYAIDQQLLHEAAIRKAVNDCNGSGNKTFEDKQFSNKLGQLQDKLKLKRNSVKFDFDFAFAFDIQKLKQVLKWHKKKLQYALYCNFDLFACDSILFDLMCHLLGLVRYIKLLQWNDDKFE